MIASPFAPYSTAETATLADLAIALAICRSIRTATTQGVPVPSRALLAWLRLRWAFRSWHRDASALQWHVASYCRIPARMLPERKSRWEGMRAGSPPHLSDVAWLMAELRMPMLDAWNLPLSDVHPLMVARGEQCGAPPAAWLETAEDQRRTSELSRATSILDQMTESQKRALFSNVAAAEGE